MIHNKINLVECVCHNFFFLKLCYLAKLVVPHRYILRDNHYSLKRPKNGAKIYFYSSWSCIKDTRSIWAYDGLTVIESLYSIMKFINWRGWIVSKEEITVIGRDDKPLGSLDSSFLAK